MKWEPVPSSSIVSLAKRNDGALLVLTTAGLVRFNGSGFLTPNGTTYSVTLLESSAEGAVWLLGEQDPLSYDSKAFVPVPVPRAAP